MKNLIWLFCMGFMLQNSGAFATPPKKILLLISSAKTLKLASPSNTPEIPVGFFLIELGGLLRKYQGVAEFVLATPDGAAPTLDLNGLDLDFHIQGWKAPYANLSTNLNPFSIPEKWNLKRYSDERARRTAELETAAQILGPLNITLPIPRSNPEAVKFRSEALRILNQGTPKKYLSFKEVLNGTDLARFDFLYIPGGHAPMVDLKNNPELGEILNQAHEKGVLIAAICHGPIALASARYRLDREGNPFLDPNFPLKGTRVTTVSTLEETLMLKVGYVHIPKTKEPTRLEYWVDQALMNFGFEVEFGGPMIGKRQILPAYPHVVFDAEKNVLTTNGPQSMDLMMSTLETVFGGEGEIAPPPSFLVGLPDDAKGLALSTKGPSQNQSFFSEFSQFAP